MTAVETETDPSSAGFMGMVQRVDARIDALFDLGRDVRPSTPAPS